MGRYSGKSCRIASMLVLTTGFLLVEIIVGHLSNSLALVADAFHMLSDTIALVVGLTAVKLARRARSKNNTYGWARAEIVGALINAVFLVALSFTILVEAVERLAMREAIEDAQLLLYVGGAGLAINLIGLLLFHNHAHGHTHGGIPHTHSHGHSHAALNADQAKCPTHLHLLSDKEETKISTEELSEEGSDRDPSMDIDLREYEGSEDGEKGHKHTAKSHQLNMRGVFIHVLGDALGSVVVMISAGITLIARKYLPGCDLSHHHHHHQSRESGISNVTLECHYRDPEWVLCIDPILSLVLVAIILSTSLPLLRQTTKILMQMVPSHLQVSVMQNRIEQIDGVLGVHEFHIWSLAGNKVVASLHVHAKSLEEYVAAAQAIKTYLHIQGIHSVTIQPEFAHLQEQKEGRVCMLECGPHMDCHRDTCCGTTKITPPCQGAQTDVNRANANNPV